MTYIIIIIIINNNTSTTPLCRLCKEKTESVTHIVSACSNLAKNQYRKRHDKLGKKIHWLLCKKFLIDCNEKWFLHEPELVQENERCKLLWDFTIQTDKVLEHRRPDIVMGLRDFGYCYIIIGVVQYYYYYYYYFFLGSTIA